MIENGEKRVVRGCDVEARVWEKGSNKRIYFKVSGQGVSGQACWDCLGNEFVKCNNQVGGAFKVGIKSAFDL
jgi:hypothetical protein